MSPSGSDARQFSKLRTFLWPVHNYELKKLVPLLLIFFLISFNYNILRILKETGLVHAKGSGAEAIPFVKVWVMFPGAVLMTYLFTRLSNRFKHENVFYIMTSVFLAFFALYLFVLYPLREYIQPNEAADWLQSILPEGASWFSVIFRHWSLSTFYAMSELWGNIVLFVLFWGFANHITRLDEAKRFYGLFGIGANFSGIVAGQVSVMLARGAYNPSLPFGSSAWEQSMILSLLLVLGAGIITLFLFRWMQRNVLTDPILYNPTEDHLDRQNKPKFSMRDSFSFLLRSRYLLCIAIIMIGYNLVINLTEVLWKSQVKELYTDPNDYHLYMNQVSSLIGLFATIAALFISGNSIRKFGWTFTAMLTPAVLLLTSVGFFSFYFFKVHAYDIVLASLGMSPLVIAVFFGSAQNVMSRAAKYSVFDATKEMTFIPLSYDERTKGKAAIDGVCSRLGKSSGALIYTFLLTAFGTLSASAPLIVTFLLLTIVIWSGATVVLGRKFNALTKEKEPMQTSPTRESTTSAQLLTPAPLLKEQQAI